MSRSEEPMARPSKHPSRGGRYAPAEKAVILEDAAKLGMASSAEKHRCAKWTIDAWLKKQERVAAALAQDSSESGGGPSTEPAPAPTQDERHALIPARPLVQPEPDFGAG